MLPPLFHGLRFLSSFSTRKGVGIAAFLELTSSRTQIVVHTMKEGNKAEASVAFIVTIPFGTWFMVTIAHQNSFFSKSTVTLATDGKNVQTQPLRYPILDDVEPPF